MSTIKTFLKKIKYKLTRDVGHLNAKLKTKKVWMGNNYGGFYIQPEQLNSTSIVYSFGIGEDISFDKAILSAFNCKVFGFDPTPKSVKWIANQDLPQGFHFNDYGIGVKTGTQDFFLPMNPDYVSGSMVLQNNVNPTQKVTVQMKCLKDICSLLGHQKIDVLKMDIEGAEYDVVKNILSTDIEIKQILIEFHDRMMGTSQTPSKETVRLLKEKGFEIFAVSDSFEEISFIKVQ